jgi:hypothetical protein
MLTCQVHRNILQIQMAEVHLTGLRKQFLKESE